MNHKYQPVIDVVWQLAEEYPERRAATHGEHTMTYSDLKLRSKKLAKIINNLVSVRGEVISVMVSPSLQAIVALTAVFESGGVYQPISEDFASRVFTRLFTETDSSIVIVHKDFLEQLVTKLQKASLSVSNILTIDSNFEIEIGKHTNGKYIFHSEEELPDVLLPSVGATDDAYLFYTSGSTGLPKGILGKHDSITHFVSWQKEEFHVTSDCRVAQLTNLTFDASLRDIFLPLISGGEIIIPDMEVKNDPVRLMKWLAEESITHVHTIPTLFRLLLRESRNGIKNNLPLLQYVYLSGEMLFVRDIMLWNEEVQSPASIVNFYGPTETTMIKSFHTIGDLAQNPTTAIHVGRPISSTMIAIVNENRICRPGEIGEVLIKTPYWTKGYYKNEDLNNQVFVPNPLTNDTMDKVYKTGDKGRYLKDGNIEILGRLDREVKVNGTRANLEGIESSLLQIEGIDEVYVLQNTEMFQSVLVCYYISSAKGLSEEKVREEALAYIDKKLIPTYFVPMAEFPISANGKIDKSALPKPREILLHEIDYVPVTSTTEAVLEDIWRSVLDLKLVGRNASFFNLGGSSLSAVQVISRIYKRLDVMISIQDVFNNLTIKELSKVVEGAQEHKQDPIDHLEKADAYPISNAQKRIWSLHQFDSEQTAYNISEAYLLEGSLDTSRFQKALEIVVASNEALRTTFIEKDDQIFQRIHPVGTQPINIGIKETNLNEEERIINEIIAHHFNLNMGPLYKIQLVQSARERTVLVMVISHIISDAWSMQLLFQAIIAAYQSLELDNDENTQEISEIHFKEYVNWLNKQKETEKYEQDKVYWLKQFDRDIQPLDLTNAKPRPDIKSFKGDKIQFIVSKELTKSINKFQEKMGFTPYMLLLAHVKTLLYCYSGQKTIVIGNPVSGRSRQEFELTLGLFVNTLPVCSTFEAGDTFEEVVALVKRNTLDAYIHDLYPLDELVEELGAGNDPGRSAMFDVMVQLQDLSIAAHQDQVEDISVSPYPLGHFTSKFDLTFDFKIRPKTIDVEIEYQTDIYTNEYMEQFKKDMLLILERSLDKPDITLRDLKKEWMQQTTLLNQRSGEFASAF